MNRPPRTCFLEIRAADGRLIQRLTECHHDDYGIALSERQKDDVKTAMEAELRHRQGLIDDKGPLLMFVDARDSAAGIVEQICHQEDERREL